MSIRRSTEASYTVALAGNPNVGKSTIFNALTGLKQHTGNWPGKTVGSAVGDFSLADKTCRLVDIPGTYSLYSHSKEEEIARDYLLFEKPDAVIVVCDAVCLERSLPLALQIAELCPRTLLCINLLDEAARKRIHVDTAVLHEHLHLPVAGAIARKKGGLSELKASLSAILSAPPPATSFKIDYGEVIESRIAALVPLLQDFCEKMPPRFLAMQLLEAALDLQNETFFRDLAAFLGQDLRTEKALIEALDIAKQDLTAHGIDCTALQEQTVSTAIKASEDLCAKAVTIESNDPNHRDRLLDRLLIGKKTAYPIMLCMLSVILWLTIFGANYPSALLTSLFVFLEARLSNIFFFLHAPSWLHGLLIEGGFRTLGWIVSVMLPPMAIFFPLFTLLEDAGYLPRVAFNLDKPFQKCKSCGKQALTMCMGLGCNAAGVVGCRIIDSPRERLIAMLTNCFVPCNGRFPLLIAVITMFFIGGEATIQTSLASALLLTAFIALGILMTLLISRLLSATVLRGVPSSFTLELPPYRRPRVGKVIIRSLFDRTLFVLGRAVLTAIPAGILIWLMANVQLCGVSLLGHVAGFLDPFARLMGLDGVILLAFILGLPANEIVIPLVMMAYLSTSSLSDYGSLAELRALLVANGWTQTTAICTMLFSLFHWPCGTTILTMKKESGGWKWALLGVLIPTAVGILSCITVAFVFRSF